MEFIDGIKNPAKIELDRSDEGSMSLMWGIMKTSKSSKSSKSRKTMSGSISPSNEPTVSPLPTPEPKETPTTGPMMSPSWSPTMSFPTYSPTTWSPTMIFPTLSPTTTTISPTSVPDGAVYYDGFEQGTFPEGDPEWTTEGEKPWELTNEEVNSGVFAIRSPNLTNSDLIPGSSNATLTANPTWGPGTLHFSVYPDVEQPFDTFEVYVDGIERGGTPASSITGFEERELQLAAGTEEITFRYQWNPNSLLQFPLKTSESIGAVFLDDDLLRAVRPGRRSPRRRPDTR